MPEIFQFWHDGSPPPLFEARIRGWSQLNPDWGHRCFDRPSAAAFIRTHFGDELAEAFLDIRFPAMMADVLRIAAVVTCGGLWVDAGTTCLRPVSEWLDMDSPVVLLRRRRMTPPIVWNGLIFSREAGHPYLAAVWDQLALRLRTRSGRQVWRHFGPGLLTRILGEGDHARSVRVQSVVDLDGMMTIGSSAEVFSKDQHWSVRQLQESLFLSVPHVPQAPRGPGGPR